MVSYTAARTLGRHYGYDPLKIGLVTLAFGIGKYCAPSPFCATLLPRTILVLCDFVLLRCVCMFQDVQLVVLLADAGRTTIWRS